MRRRPEAEILASLRDAFLVHGFEAPSMEDLARASGLSRRTLYYRYPNKDSVYRAMIGWLNEDAIFRGFEAGRLVRSAGGAPIDIVSEIFDVRFGVTRRMVESSPHSVELNAVAFAKCRDIAIDVAIRFQHGVADLIASLVDEGAMRLRPTFSAPVIAQILSHGARGVNYALPPVPPENLSSHYRQMCEAVLLGAIVQTRKPKPRSQPAVRKGSRRRARP